jgi:hypothetical protein
MLVLQFGSVSLEELEKFSGACVPDEGDTKDVVLAAASGCLLGEKRGTGWLVAVDMG